MAKQINCTECDGNYENKSVSYSCAGVNIGDFPALVCNKCGDTMFESHVREAIEKELKKRKLWGWRARAIKQVLLH